MKLKTDYRGRITSRELFKPNTAYEAEKDGNRIVMVELVPKAPLEAPKAHLVKVGGRLLAAGAKVTNEDTQKAMAEFP